MRIVEVNEPHPQPNSSLSDYNLLNDWPHPLHPETLENVCEFAQNNKQYYTNIAWGF